MQVEALTSARVAEGRGAAAEVEEVEARVEEVEAQAEVACKQQKMRRR